MRTEEQLGKDMLAFERKMARMGRRPALPVDFNAPAKLAKRIPQAVERAQAVKVVRDQKFREILEVLKDLEALNATQIADRMGCSAQKLNTYLRLMNAQGYLHKIETQGDRKIVYAYIKTGKVFG
jgi:predicted transcriptional regulator